MIMKHEECVGVVNTKWVELIKYMKGVLMNIHI